MRRRFFGRSQSVYPLKTCHFCNTESHIVPPHPSIKAEELDTSHSDFIASSSKFEVDGSKANVSTGVECNWFCSVCQCWNRADENDIGGISSWEIKMSDEKQNIDSLQRRAVSTSSIVLPQGGSSSSPFCHSCQTNQMLILSILANGDTDEMSDREVVQWQLSLEDRYPPVCEICNEMVKTRIEKADKIARRLIWNGWLKKSKEKKSSTSADDEFQKCGHDMILTRIPRSTSVSVYWIAQLVAYLSSLSLTISIIWQRPRVGCILHNAHLAALCTLYLVSKGWDPSIPRQILLQKHFSPGTHIKIEGLSRFRKAQALLLFLQIIEHLDILDSLHLVKEYLFGGSRSEYESLVATVHTAVHASIALAILPIVKVIEPPKVSLKSRARQNLSTSSKHTDGQPALDMLSLSPTTSHSTELSDRLAPPPETNGQTEEVEMDWTPTPDLKNARFNDDFQLGPQRFFEPLRQTGLEELLDKTLAFGERSRARSEDKRGVSSSSSSVWLLSILVTTSIVIGAIICFSPSLRYKLNVDLNHLQEIAMRFHSFIRSYFQSYSEKELESM